MPRSPQLALLLFPMAVVLGVSDLSAQGTRQDYQRSVELRKQVANKVAGQGVRLRWFADDDGAWYRVDRGDGRHARIPGRPKLPA